MPDAALEKRIGQVVDEQGEVLDSASPALLAARKEIQSSRERLIKQLESVLRGIEAARKAGKRIPHSIGAMVFSPSQRQAAG